MLARWKTPTPFVSADECDGGEQLRITNAYGGGCELRVCISTYNDEEHAQRLRESFAAAADASPLEVHECAQRADFLRLACKLKNARATHTVADICAWLRTELWHAPAGDVSSLVEDYVYFEEEGLVLWPGLVLNHAQWRQFTRWAAYAHDVDFINEWVHPMLTRGSPAFVNSLRRYAEVADVTAPQRYSLFPSRAQIFALDLCALPNLPPLRLPPADWFNAPVEQCLYASDRAILWSDGTWALSKWKNNDYVNDAPFFVHVMNIVNGGGHSKYKHIHDVWPATRQPKPLPTFEMHTPDQREMLAIERLIPANDFSGHNAGGLYFGFGGRLCSERFYGPHRYAPLPPPQHVHLYANSPLVFSLASGAVTHDWIVLRYRSQSPIADDVLRHVLETTRDWWYVHFEHQHGSFNFHVPMPGYEFDGGSWTRNGILHAETGECYVLLNVVLTPSQWLLMEMCAHAALQHTHNAHVRKAHKKIYVDAMHTLPLAAGLPAHLNLANYLSFVPRTDTARAMEDSVGDDYAALWDVDAVRQALCSCLGYAVEDDVFAARTQFTRDWLVFNNEVGLRRHGAHYKYYMATIHDPRGTEMRLAGAHVPMQPKPMRLATHDAFMQRAVGASGLVRYDWYTREYRPFRAAQQATVYATPEVDEYVEVVNEREHVSERLDAEAVVLEAEAADLTVTAVSGPTGAGKTTMIRGLTRRWLAQGDRYVVVVVTPRVGICEQIAADLERELGNGVVGSWKLDRTLWAEKRAMVTTAHSLHRFIDCEEPYVDGTNHAQRVMLIFDEVNTTFMEDLLEVEVLKPARFERALTMLLPHSNVRHVALVDANLDAMLVDNVIVQRARHAIKYFLAGQRVQRPLHIIVHPHRATFNMVSTQERTAIMFNQRDAFRLHIVDLLKAGERVAIFFARKQELRTMREYYRAAVPDARIKEVSADERPDWANLVRDIEAQDVTLLLYTTVASAGIDLTFANDACHFTYVALEGLNQNHLSLIQLYQAISRVRNTTNLLLYCEREVVSDPFTLFGTHTDFERFVNTTPAQLVDEYLSVKAKFTEGIRAAFEATRQVIHIAVDLVTHNYRNIVAPSAAELHDPSVAEHPFAVSYALGSYYKYLRSCRATLLVSLLLRVGYRVQRSSREECSFDTELRREHHEAVRDAVVSASQQQLFPVALEDGLDERALMVAQRTRYADQLLRMNDTRKRLGLPYLTFPLDDVVPVNTFDYVCASIVPTVEQFIVTLPNYLFPALDMWHYLARMQPRTEVDWQRALRAMVACHVRELGTAQQVVQPELEAASAQRDRALLAAIELHCTASLLGADFLPSEVRTDAEVEHIALPDPLQLHRVELVENTVTWKALMHAAFLRPTCAFYKYRTQTIPVTQGAVAATSLFTAAMMEHVRLPFEKKKSNRQRAVRFDGFAEWRWLRALYYTWRYGRADVLNPPNADEERVDFDPFAQMVRAYKHATGPSEEVQPFDAAEVVRVKKRARV